MNQALSQSEPATDLRKAIWEAIKDWDINTPEYIGYCKATGSHVNTIFNAIQALTQPEPAPVGYVTNSGTAAYLHRGVYLEDDTPLYVAPPKKQWVGLTEKDRDDLEDYCEMIIGKAAFDAIESKLKEKNE